MSASLIKTAVKAVLDSVPGVDATRVYKAQRKLTTDKIVKDIMCGTSNPPFANAWFISITGFTDKMKSIGTSGFNERLYTVSISGYYSVDDTTTPTSEESFENLCELISDYMANSIRSQLQSYALGCHVDEFPEFKMMYALFLTGGMPTYHKAEATMTLNVWHQRA